ncbi:UNVERIFIED_CONTAM: hypothetical protein FKN15_047737 [Acipenser sinensis]
MAQSWGIWPGSRPNPLLQPYKFLQVPWTAAPEPCFSVFRTQAALPCLQPFPVFPDFLEEARLTTQQHPGTQDTQARLTTQQHPGTQDTQWVTLLLLLPPVAYQSRVRLMTPPPPDSFRVRPEHHLLDPKIPVALLEDYAMWMHLYCE